MLNHLYIQKKRTALLSAIKPHLNWIWKYRFSIISCFVLIYVIKTKDINLQLSLSSITDTRLDPVSTIVEEPNEPRAAATSNSYSNLGFNKASTSDKRRKQLAYIQRFSKIAQTEMNKFGIPASIKLAQGLLESNAGESPLSRKNNNHFGMKCFSSKCKKGHCSNFSDDSHKDFFRVYQNAWESYRAHSKMLQKKRYKGLFQLDKKDYKAWARGLKAAGYATDKRYAEKIIHLIEDLELYRYDRNA